MNPDSFYSSYEPTKKLLAEYKSHTLLSLFNGSDKDMSKYSVSEVKDNKNYTTAQVISKILEKPAIKATKSRVFSY
jgi:UTP-glucose-1-phosphate uridylyltransferase